MKELIPRIVADFVLAVLVVLVLVQLRTSTQTLSQQRMYAESLVSYSELIPDKMEYYPGEIVSFTYIRKANIGSDPILMMTVDSFENTDTGEVFPGIQASRIVRKSGESALRATRVLPPQATPGNYVFEGLLSIQGNMPIRSVWYTSRAFRVIKPPEPPPTKPKK